jgi:tRNA G26 N,N-dimethylase Trm1
MDNIKKLIKKHLNTLNEERTENYMFFSNLEQIRRQCDILLNLDKNVIEDILQNGHDWADDHVSVAKENMDQVLDFLMNQTEDGHELHESKKKKKNKLCSRGISAAKSKFDVYPSAYANGYAVQVCKGKIKGLDGKKRCSGSYCKKKK